MSPGSAWWCERAWLPGGTVTEGVLVEADATGTIVAVHPGTPRPAPRPDTPPNMGTQRDPAGASWPASDTPRPASGTPRPTSGTLPQASGDAPAGPGSSGSATDAEPAVAVHPVILPGLTVPGLANTHSHAFHRVLRGRTHDAGGTFWSWRERMYAAAAQLTPQRYRVLATAVFTEMVVAGFTSVAEFHYVHHGPDGTPYADHAMERALAEAAVEAGIRLTLLDTCYLAGGFGRPVEPGQRRFSDGTAEGWLDRHRRLADALLTWDLPGVRLGTALHSVRAVPPEALAAVARALPDDEPRHLHLSEQPAENDQCLAAYGRTPTELLADAGLLTDRLTAVHATHLTEHDIGLLGQAGATVAMCPTTEADLADGIGPARELADAGAFITLGTDQHAVIDPWLEMRALEHGERLRTGQRGRFSPVELLDAARGTDAALGAPPGAIAVGAPCDLVGVDLDSVRTAGSRPGQVPLTATAADVRDVVVAGVRRAHGGTHTSLGDPATLLATALREFCA